MSARALYRVIAPAAALLYGAPSFAYIHAVELKPVAAVELAAPKLRPVAAVELPPPAIAPVMAKELPPFRDAETSYASAEPSPAPTPIALQKPVQTADNAEPAPTWTPVAHDTSLTPADYNPAVY